MARLLIHVEGQTEEAFVNEVLRDHLVERGYYSVEARILGNARMRQRRGGIRQWQSAKTDIVNHLKEDAGRICTMMVDYYALPESWPGRVAAKNQLSSENKALMVQDGLGKDVAEAFGVDRFIPYVVMHEFERLLFSDCVAFGTAIERPDLVSQLTAIRKAFATPEEINDSPVTAPSMRIRALAPGYEKPLLGVRAAKAIGLPRIRKECTLFDRWLRAVESRVSSKS